MQFLLKIFAIFSLSFVIVKYFITFAAFFQYFCYTFAFNNRKVLSPTLIIRVDTNQNFNIEHLEESLKNDVDAMLMAYETGWVERGIDDVKQLESRIKTNLDNTVNYIKEVISYFRKLELNLNGAFIKLERPNSISVILTVPVETFIDEKLLQVYSFTYSIERHSRSDDYRVAFSIMYNDGNINNDALLADGFFGLFREKIWFAS